MLLDTQERVVITLPTNSEQLYLILAALTGDSDPNLWRIGALQGLVKIVRHYGLPKDLDEDNESAFNEALYKVDDMLNRLKPVLGTLPENIPTLCDPAEVAALKSDWEDDGTWDLEDTRGFEAHAEDLLRHRLEFENRQHQDSQRKTSSTLHGLATLLAPYLKQSE